MLKVYGFCFVILEFPLCHSEPALAGEESKPSCHTEPLGEVSKDSMLKDISLVLQDQYNKQGKQ